MKFRLPSFRTQIIILVILLLVTSVLLFREFFIERFYSYSNTSIGLNTNEKLRQLHTDYSSKLDSETQIKYRQDIEAIMSTETQKSIARDVFIDEIELYSKFIFVFLTFTVAILFFISFYFITRPIKRLQIATARLAKGDLGVIVKDSKFSPLNDLIISFNSMTQELQSNRNKLIQAEKDAAWRDMARVLAHEIKNPLTPMRLSLERLEMKYSQKSKDIDDVFSNVTRVIHEEIDNLQSFAKEFSNFAKIPEASPKYYNLNEQITDVCNPYHSEYKIQLDLTRELPDLYADKMQIKQVLENLIQNSINAAQQELLLKISTSVLDDNISIKIKDNGKGISKDDLKNIFKPYFTRSSGGTGLGLAIVNRIILNHNGIIEVESTVGEGTTFAIALPIHQQGIEK